MVMSMLLAWISPCEAVTIAVTMFRRTSRLLGVEQTGEMRSGAVAKSSTRRLMTTALRTGVATAAVVAIAGVAWPFDVTSDDIDPLPSATSLVPAATPTGPTTPATASPETAPPPAAQTEEP